MTQEEKYEKLNRLIAESKKTVFFGGAGVSTESGIPDFRSKDGLYNVRDVQFEQYEPEYLLSIDCLENEPEVFYEFYRQKLETSGIKPNKAHYRLAEMEKAGKLTAVVTQNIDGLHQKAGSRVVYELHGSVHRNYCTKCGKFFDGDFIRSCEGVPRCDECGGLVKPDVVLYEEGLDQNVINGAVNAIRNADCLIIGGTSLVVYPAAGLIDYFSGDKLVLVNKSATSRDRMADLVISGPIGEVFSCLRV